MLEEMRKMIAEQLNCEESEITADTSFKDDLGADSLDIFQIIMAIEEEFEIEIPAVEVSYICLHIKGAKHEKIQWDGQKINAIENRELRGLLNEMVDAFDPESAYLLKQDEEFIQGLLAHLRPTLIRLDHGMQIQNPVLDDIKQNYTDIYQKCLNVSKVLERFTGKPVPEEQLSFIYRLKTGALLEASMRIGAVLAGAGKEEEETVERIAADVGMAFQIQDDILDLVSTAEVLGKPVLSDEKNEKTTYVTLKGLEKAKAEVKTLSDRAAGALNSLPGDKEFLGTLIKTLVDREK